jgi:NAD(P)-dependent dehydrogenase (short-subunit alcohol dehydrogenase family)
MAREIIRVEPYSTYLERWNAPTSAVSRGGGLAVVTGALSGIGRASAMALAEAGARVIVSGRRLQAGEELVAELRAAGHEATFVAADVRHEAEVEALIDSAVTTYGRLDIAVNNAGADGEMVPFADLNPDRYAAVFDTNVLGTLLSIKHELRVMKPQGHGSIINISSIYGERGFPLNAPYVASKHAINGLTRVAAVEAAPASVRVNALAPGPVQTAMFDRVTGGDPAVKAQALTAIPQGRAGEPSEVGDAVVFLGSSRAAFLTGQIIGVDGGFLAT